MSASQKILAGSVAGVLWLGAIAAKHFWPDINIEAFTVTCAAALSALGIHSASQGAPK